MQTTFLPQEVPQVQGWEFAARWEPAREVAGDYYDFIPVGPDSLGLVIADVTDKGAPAALFMVFSNSIVRASVHPSISPADSIANANRLICSKSPNAMFVSLVYLLINTQTGQAAYVNAGHNPPLYYHAGEDRLERLSRTGMVLGIAQETGFTQRSLDLQHGDLILLYTDGLTDAINAQQQDFGMDLLEVIVWDNRHLSAEEIINRLQDALIKHSGDITPFDDVTLLLVKRL